MEPMLSLVAACCRPRLDAADLDLLRPQLSAADGAHLLLVARRHRVEGLVWRTLERAEIVPVGAERLGWDARRIAMDGLRMAAESGRIHRAFATSSLPHLFIKGQTLGTLAWCDPFLKRQLDIDLLVMPEAIAKAAALLGRLGYVQEVPEPSVDPADWHRSRKESLWRSDDGILLDLHSRVADNRKLLPSVTAAVSPRMVEIASGIVLPTLPERLLLPYLAVHGASSAWFRLKWIADFAALAARTEPEKLAAQVEQAPRLGAGRTMAAAMVLGNRLLGLPLPESLDVDGGTRRLVALSMRALADEREPTDRPLGTLPIHFAQLVMIPGSHYLMSESLRQVGGLFIR
ncbi:nucleotidyltransferase family protein [Sphingomonas sp. LHG3406-1]|uniref:nucleotidyltransferase family protein n=1 Tax=Sphingomonas sp. LHG3406-1 TaxID=2804617 RepID=UPI002638E143|nr:nucleotidyltransferase family protein [Sphingomonas sp. LHG3406-1]